MQKNIGIALLGIFVLALILWPQKSLPPVTGSGAAVGGAFTLTDMHGRIVHDTDFRGRPLLVYMGFSRCPDICPMALSTMGNALRMLGPDADKVTMAFITLDPGHDTPQVLEAYLKPFDPRILGLTGTKAQIDSVVKAYKSYYSRSFDSNPSAAPVIQHSGLLFVMDENGKYDRHFQAGVTADEIATEVEKLRSNAANHVSPPRP